MQPKPLIRLSIVFEVVLVVVVKLLVAIIEKGLIKKSRSRKFIRKFSHENASTWIIQRGVEDELH